MEFSQLQNDLPAGVTSVTQKGDDDLAFLKTNDYPAYEAKIKAAVAEYATADQEFEVVGGAGKAEEAAKPIAYFHDYL